MKKFSTEEITNIISNETNIWEQFKQNMKRWEKKLEVYGINIKLEQYWENNIYDPDEIFNQDGETKLKEIANNLTNFFCEIHLNFRQIFP